MHWDQRTPWWKNMTVTTAEPQPDLFQQPALQRSASRERCCVRCAVRTAQKKLRFLLFRSWQNQGLRDKMKKQQTPHICSSLISPLPLAHQNLRLFSPLSHKISKRKPRKGWNKTYVAKGNSKDTNVKVRGHEVKKSQKHRNKMTLWGHCTHTHSRKILCNSKDWTTKHKSN